MTDLHQFEAFMRDYQNMVFTTAYRLVGQKADAEDISQAVFLKAFEHWDNLRISPTAGGWLRTVATNLSLNHLSRYRARWRFFSELAPEREDESGEFLDTQAAPDATDQAVAARDDRSMIELALLKLPHAQRVPLALYHFEDLDYDEIATRLRVSLSKVKTDIHRGRLALKKHLQTRLADDPRWETSDPKPQ